MARKRYKLEEIVAKLRRSTFWSRRASHGGRNPPDRGERGDVLSVAPGVWQAEERAGEAPEGPGASEQPAAQGGFSDLTLDKLILQEAARGNF
jgi:hypothetical protein